MSGKPMPEGSQSPIKSVRDAAQYLIRYPGDDYAQRHLLERIDQLEARLTAAQQQGQAVAYIEHSADKTSVMHLTPAGMHLGIGRHACHTAPPPSVPVGWKLVPTEPTEAMQDAHRMYGDTSDWWNAVLAAAPALATQHQEPKP